MNATPGMFRLEERDALTGGVVRVIDRAFDRQLSKEAAESLMDLERAQHPARYGPDGPGRLVVLGPDHKILRGDDDS